MNLSRETESQMVDEQLVKQLLAEIMTRAGKAHKHDYEFTFDYPLNGKEQGLLGQFLRKNGSFAQRVSLLPTTTKEGAGTLITIRKKGK